jgi:hypothetical protein
MNKMADLKETLTKETAVETTELNAVDFTKMSKAELIAALALATAKKPRKERAKKTDTVSFFLKTAIMATPETGKTDLEIFEDLKAAFPLWKSEGRKWYVSWYRYDLRRKGTENVPNSVKPAASTTGKTVAETFVPEKLVKDMTKEERKEYITKRNRELKAEGKHPIMGTTDPSLPTATTTKARRKK